MMPAKEGRWEFGGVCTMNEEEGENEKCGMLADPPLVLSTCLLFQ